ncbi:MAG: MetQ/NlpA family ABC transporter substrate-binding protein [Clostridia bacterium]|nr:MetQ/NlpA family ABC transporter substrate-binding protein [Clostridia bacterium]
MKKLVKTISAVALSLSIAGSVASLTACGSAEADPYIITVGASITPHAEILENVVKPKLEEYGYTLKVVEYQDYIQPNLAVEQDELDANYFQHNLYLEDFNATRGTHLKAVAQVHYEPFAIYAGSSYTGSLQSLSDGAKIGVPNDGTNEARALLLLQKEGLITLKSGVTASLITKNDIVSNPKNLDIVELEAAQIAQHLPSLSAGVINGNYALQNNLKIESAIASEDANDQNVKQYVNVLAVKDGNEDNPKIKALKTALLSVEVKDYIVSTYGGAVVSVF